jgi:hypothetical protein
MRPCALCADARTGYAPSNRSATQGTTMRTHEYSHRTSQTSLARRDAPRPLQHARALQSPTLLPVMMILLSSSQSARTAPARHLVSFMSPLPRVRGSSLYPNVRKRLERAAAPGARPCLGDGGPAPRRSRHGRREQAHEPVIRSSHGDARYAPACAPGCYLRA